MTRNEKIAITTSAVVGFVAFCLSAFLIVVPFLNHISYIFGDSGRAREVVYADLAYAMGDEFVFVSDDAFDEKFWLEGNACVNSFGKSSQYSKTKSIRGAKNYHFTAITRLSGGVDYRIRITCEKWQDGDYDLEYTYGNVKYSVDDVYVDAVVIVGKVPNGKGKQNKLSAVFTVASEDGRTTNLSAPNKLQCQEIFHYILDNIVSYSQFND